MNTYERARQFVFRNARPLDYMRWKFFFEGGSPENVADLLASYQNADGGFGHGLEADCLNPGSSPIQTWSATMILREIGLYDPKHPIVAGVIRYLESGAHFDGHCWAATVPGNDAYPHAPWWSYRPQEPCERNYNPTASLAGYLLRSASTDSHAHALARRIALEACEYYMSGAAEPEMHLLPCFMGLCRDVQAVEPELLDTERMWERLRTDVRRCLEADAGRWNGEYCALPSDFITGKADPMLSGLEAMAKRECAWIEESQLESGAWPVCWRWSDYPDDYAVSANRWQSTLAIRKMLFLKEMGAL